MEFWDIYDKNRNKTGKVINRQSKQLLKEGEYHLVVEALIVNKKGQILLSKRAPSKKVFPLLWECCGGSAIQGEDSKTAILRETKEELGLELDISQGILYKTIRNDEKKDFKDIWLWKKEVDISKLQFSDGEVIEAKWVTVEEFKQMQQKEKLIPTIDITTEDFKKVEKEENKIIMATHSEEKVNQIKKILKNRDIISMKELGIEIEIEENENSFEGNALKKARTIAQMTNRTCLGDDGGLWIETLNGFPGVKTARFLGEYATKQERNGDIIEKMKGKKDRRAKSITCLALVTPKGEEKLFWGVVEGRIAEQIRGTRGSGYDPIFEMQDGRTFAQISQEEMDKVCNRYLALMELEGYLKNKNRKIRVVVTNFLTD